MADENTNRDALIQAVTEQVSKPQTYSVDGESVTQRSMADIEVALRLIQKLKISPKNALKCIGVVKASTPGTNER